MITKHGRDSLVVMPVQKWECRDRRIGLATELPEEWVEAVSKARAPEKFGHLDADLE